MEFAYEPETREGRQSVETVFEIPFMELFEIGMFDAIVGHPTIGAGCGSLLRKKSSE